MSETKIKELLETLFSLQYNWKSGGSSYTSDVINKDSRQNVEVIIRKFLLEAHDKISGELEAKCYAYEQIIAKSSFSPMLPIKDKEEDIAVKDALAEIKALFDAIYHGHSFIIDKLSNKKPSA